ncbi:MAG TPA: HutD family protein [Kofleriaceae bacterium]|jgi:environmental stress-induced protein Ves
MGGRGAMIEIPREDWRKQPWKNGLGVTFEILRDPDVDAYDVRISIADDTQPATFSTFPGYVRWSFLAGTAPIRLTQPNGTTAALVALGDSLRTAGETVLTSELPAGATQLLNVIARAELVDAGKIVVGYGPVAHPVRYRFDLVEQIAHRYHEPTRAETAGCVWIA